MIQNRVKYNWPLEVQIEFEKADLVNNTKYFKKNWDEYHEHFASHALIRMVFLNGKTVMHGLKQALIYQE